MSCSPNATRSGGGSVSSTTSTHFDEPALASLVLSIGMINIWNRLNVATSQIAGAWKAAA